MANDLNNLIESLSSAHVDDKDEGTLSFEGKQLKLNTAEDAEPIAREIEKLNDSLKVLILKGNTINFPAAERISEALKKCKNLKRALWSDIFTGRSKAETPPSLKFFSSGLLAANVSLTELDLSDNALSIAGAEAIKELLSSSACYTLEVLKLNNDGLGSGGGKIIAQALIDCWEASKRAGRQLKLKVFIAGRNRLENPGAEALAEAFKKIGTLEEVTMPQNGIYYRGITALAKAFSVNHNLTRINLSDNTFTVLGALAMANVLVHLKKLEVINFSDCLLRSKGGSTLASALKSNCPNLKELCVSGNELNSDTALSLADAVMNGKKNFEKLEIGCNNIGQSGLEDLKDLFNRKNASKCLASLSDDEGTADEEDEEENDNENVEVSNEQDEEYEDDEEGEQGEYEENDQASPTEPYFVTDNYVHDDKSLLSTGEEAYESTRVEKFLSSYDVDTLKELGNDGPDLILQHLRSKLFDAKFSVDVLCRISSVVTPKSDTTVKELAFSSCGKILQNCFSVCDVALFSDYLAAILGLIKSEEKEKISNTYGLISFLEEECTKSYFSKTTKDILKFLIEKHLTKVLQHERQMWINLFNALQT